MEDEVKPTDGDSNDDNVIADEPIEVDERGVPTRNVYAEYMRKLSRMEKRLGTQFENRIKEKEEQIAELKRQMITPPPVTQALPKEEDPRAPCTCTF